MKTIKDVVDALDLSFAVGHYKCSEEHVKSVLLTNAQHVLDLMKRHRLKPRSNDRIISIGCGHAEELIALVVLYSGKDFSYTGVDLGGDCIFVCQAIFKNLGRHVMFIRDNAAELTPSDGHVAGYDLIIMRHPHFLFEENEQFSDFKVIAEKTIPALHRARPAVLFCTFYEKIESQRFLQFLPSDVAPVNLSKESKYFLIEDKQEVYKNTDPTLDNEVTFSDRYSICLRLRPTFVINHWDNPPRYSPEFFKYDFRIKHYNKNSKDPSLKFNS